jgi:hypothetical protein
MRNILFLLILLSFGTAFGQWKETTLDDFSQAILASEGKISANSSYSFETVYLFFEQHTGTEQTLRFNGKIVCDAGKELYMDQFDRWTVQDSRVNVVCDTAQHMIILNDVDPALVTRRTDDSYKLFLKSKCTVQKQVTGKSVRYLITFSPGDRYKSAEIWFRENGLVEKYTLLSGVEVTDDTQMDAPRTIEPRLEIFYNNYLFGDKAAVKTMRRVSHFVTAENGKYTLTPAYAGYQLIDLRTPSN